MFDILVADKLADEVLSLPMGPHLADRAWITKLQETIRLALPAEVLFDVKHQQRSAGAKRMVSPRVDGLHGPV